MYNDNSKKPSHYIKKVRIQSYSALSTAMRCKILGSGNAIMELQGMFKHNSEMQNRTSYIALHFCQAFHQDIM
jgi:hypothetical protein